MTTQPTVHAVITEMKAAARRFESMYHTDDQSWNDNHHRAAGTLRKFADMLQEIDDSQ